MRQTRQINLKPFQPQQNNSQPIQINPHAKFSQNTMYQQINRSQPQHTYSVQLNGQNIGSNNRIPVNN